MLEILVIDDESPRHSWFRNSFDCHLGWTVDSALSSAKALELLRTRRYHLAFFDHDLAEHDFTGSDIATRILMDPDTYHCPQAVWVHSANPVGAENIASKFRSAQVPTIVSAFGELLATPIESLRETIENLLKQRDV